jgi:hypothetical protein
MFAASLLRDSTMRSWTSTVSPSSGQPEGLSRPGSPPCGAGEAGLQGVPFDPNAALRKKMGVGPGLQDSEALRPAVWVDENSEEARKASADALEFDAQRALDRAKAEADAIRKGEPF